MQIRLKHISILSGLLCLACATACLLIFSAYRDLELRLPASNLFRALDSHDYDAKIENHGDADRVWGIRAPIPRETLGPEIAWASQYALDSPNIVASFLDKPFAGPYLPQRVHEDKSGPPHLLAPILTSDGQLSPHLLAALPSNYEEPLDVEGKPVRWSLPDHLLAGYSLLPARGISTKKTEKPELPPLPAIPRSARASYYRELVENFAQRYNLNVSLVMAIIHSESDFSPTLVSNKSAMGLMQLLPSTASDEVHRFLYGRRGQVGFEDLRVPETNIRYGTAYLHILLNRYFQNVQNRDVRECCAIASYNLGPNRFLRLYGSTNEQAIEKINKMGEEEFYEDLLKRLPARETRYYVEKVRRMKKHYSSLP